MNPHVSGEVSSYGPNDRFQMPQEERTLSHGEPAAPLLRVLPIKRWIPQDIHSVMDYAGGLTVGSGYFLPEDSRDDAACWASLALGAGIVGVSLLTDYRLSVAKVIPIRAHESLDHVWGLSAIALPFLLGYWKSSPRTALTHVVVGASTVLASLFTDYRSYKEERARKRADKKARKEWNRSQADLEAVMPT